MSSKIAKEQDILSLQVWGRGLGTPSTIPTKPTLAARVAAMRERLMELRRNAQTVELWLDEMENMLTS